MTALGIILFILLNIFLIDFVARQMVRNTKEASSKTAGIFALFMLALCKKAIKDSDKASAIRRYILSVAISIFLWCILFLVLSHNPLNQISFLTMLLYIMPLLVMPFYYLTFSFLGNKALALMASTKIFRLRSILALVMGANLVLANQNNPNSAWIFVIWVLFFFLALSNVFYLLAFIRAQATFYTIDREDNDVGPMGFFYYLCAILEFFYYCAAFYHLLIGKFLYNILPEYELWLSFISLLLTYALSFVTAKLFMIKRSAISLSFYEASILPLTFLFYGMALIIEHYSS